MSKLQVDSVDEVTSANGVTIDGLNIKDSKLTTANSVVTTNITDANVTTAKITDANVTTAKIADANVTTAKIADANITVAKMAANSVDSNQYVDGSIDTAHIANDQITNALMADNAIDTAQIAASAVETAKINDNAVTLAKMASGTDGNIISYDASGNPVAVATGSSGQVLTSAGAGAVPSFQAAAAGGKVLQVVSKTITSEQSTTSTSFTDVPGLTLSIAPSSSSNKVLIIFSGGSVRSSNTMYDAKFTIVRNSTNLGDSNNGFGVSRATSNQFYFASANFLDSPSTTSATTYKIQFLSDSGATASICKNDAHSTITAMEIGA